MPSLIRAFFISLICLGLLGTLQISNADDQKADAKELKDAKKAEWSVQLIRDLKGPDRIENLILPLSPIPVVLLPHEGRLRPLVEIHGSFSQEGWSLSTGDLTLVSATTTGRGQFILSIYLNSKYSEVFFTVKGPDGEIRAEKITILAPNVQEYRIGTAWGELMLSLGGTSLSYYQTQFGDFSSKTAILGMHYTTPRWSSPFSRFGMASDLRMTFLTIRPKPDNQSPQLIGAKLDATYLLDADPTTRFTKSILVGASYLTMLSNGSSFGFANLLVAEGGLLSNFRLGANSALLASARYSPIASLFDFSQFAYELKLGLSARLQNSHRVEFDLDLTHFIYRASDSNVIKGNLFAITLGYSI